MKKLLFVCAAVAALASCAKENTNYLKVDGEQYVSVRFVSTDSATRGTEGAFEDGTAAESNIANAIFIFYNADGSYNCTGETIGTIGTTAKAPANDNVEYVGDAVVVLKDVEVLPAQVLCVANSTLTTANFTNKSLTEAQAIISNGVDGYKITTGGTDYFTMTNSTYMSGSAVKIGTTLASVNVQKSEALAKANPVDIYVERLAAKVTLSYKDEAAQTHTEEVYYDNSSNKAEIEINVLGWGVNAVNKSGYYLKNIDTGWSTDVWNWNDATNFRCYWAKDPIYSEGTYPGSYFQMSQMTDPTTTSLQYYSLAALNVARTQAYCQEHPLYSPVFKVGETTVYPAATSVLVFAQMKLKSETAYVDLFKYKGVFFTEANYLATIASELSAQGYTVNGAAVTAADIKVADFSDGIVTIAPTSTSDTAWALDGTSKTIAELGTAFDPFVGTDAYSAKGYKEGKMYYNVPIEHFGNAGEAFGEWGVVRNHWYKVTVNGIGGIGHPIYDPEEPIVPNFSEDTYYIAAQINILSWKVVSQNVTLQ